MAKCALCQKESELQISHIVPKFVGKHLKATSIGNIRSQANPGKPIQDIEKHALLCHDCEELFSASERYFANTVFYPYLRDKKDIFSYDARLHFFLTSLAWRSLYLDILDFVKNGGIRIDVLETMINAEKVMREYLLSSRTDIDNIEHHIFFFDRVQSVSQANLKKANVAVHRAICSYSGNCDNTVFTISNMMGIIAIALYSVEPDEKWEKTKITNGVGQIEAKNQNMASRIGGEIQYWIEESDKALENLNETQRQKIVQKLIDLGEDIVKYPIYQDFVDDRDLQNNTSD